MLYNVLAGIVTILLRTATAGLRHVVILDSQECRLFILLPPTYYICACYWLSESDRDKILFGALIHFFLRGIPSLKRPLKPLKVWYSSNFFLENKSKRQISLNGYLTIIANRIWFCQCTACSIVRNGFSSYPLAAESQLPCTIYTYTIWYHTLGGNRHLDFRVQYIMTVGFFSLHIRPL